MKIVQAVVDYLDSLSIIDIIPYKKQAEKLLCI